jgi:hypothetical protein
VYTLADLSLRDKIYTADNPHGLLALSTQAHDMVLACPSVTTGHVRVELYGLRKTVVRGLDSVLCTVVVPCGMCVDDEAMRLLLIPYCDRFPHVYFHCSLGPCRLVFFIFHSCSASCCW